MGRGGSCMEQIVSELHIWQNSLTLTDSVIPCLSLILTFRSLLNIPLGGKLSNNFVWVLGVHHLVCAARTYNENTTQTERLWISSLHLHFYNKTRNESKSHCQLISVFMLFLSLLNAMQSQVSFIQVKCKILNKR